MKLTDKLNIKLHPWMRKYVFHTYDSQMRQLKKNHPELFAPVDPDITQKHLELWGRFGTPANDLWLRYLCNVSGIVDYRYCPSSFFYAYVERMMNECDHVGYGIEDKNELWRYLPEGVEPHAYLRYIRGSFYDEDGHWVSADAAKSILDSLKVDLVGKGCRSSGGAAVQLFQFKDGIHKSEKATLTPEWISNQGVSYVVQEKLAQNSFAESLNPGSVNTVRLMTMRCPWNGEVVPLRAVMRLGTKAVLVDNLSQGGVSVGVDLSGRFADECIDDYGNHFMAHPTSGTVFSEIKHPFIGDMARKACEIHAGIPFYNLLSFDLIVRADGSLCVVEINATSMASRMLQQDFGPLFGDRTEKLVEWCVEHQSLDFFEHVRTWY